MPDTNVLEGIHVLLEISAGALEDDAACAYDACAAECERSLSPVLEALRSGDELAEALALPASIPVRFQVRVRPRAEGDWGGRGGIPVKATVVAVPPLLARKRVVVEDELTDQVFRTLRRVRVPAPLAAALGYREAAPDRFDLEFDDAEPAVETIPEPVAQQCAPGSQFSWSKGCSSWPW